jgi:hypothetical protein
MNNQEISSLLLFIFNLLKILIIGETILQYDSTGRY